jgi:hypothetical protein
MVIVFGVLLVISGWIFIHKLLEKEWLDVIYSGVLIFLAALPLIVYPSAQKEFEDNTQKCIEKEGIYMIIEKEYKCIRDIVFIELD